MTENIKDKNSNFVGKDQSENEGLARKPSDDGDQNR